MAASSSESIARSRNGLCVCQGLPRASVKRDRSCPIKRRPDGQSAEEKNPKQLDALNRTSISSPSPVPCKALGTSPKQNLKAE